eukprot:g41542.t1
MAAIATGRPEWEDDDIEEVDEKNKKLSDRKSESEEACLHITLFKAYNLTRKDRLGSGADPYVTVSAMLDGKEVYKCGKSTCRKGLNPRFDDDLPPWKSDPKKKAGAPSADWVLQFDVWDRDITTPDFMGRAEFSLGSLKDTKWSKHILPLAPRPGKQDKVSGYLAVAVRAVLAKPSASDSDSAKQNVSTPCFSNARSLPRWTLVRSERSRALWPQLDFIFIKDSVSSVTLFY